jgi:hypothetical protein
MSGVAGSVAVHMEEGFVKSRIILKFDLLRLVFDTAALRQICWCKRERRAIFGQHAGNESLTYFALETEELLSLVTGVLLIRLFARMGYGWSATLRVVRYSWA